MSTKNWMIGAFVLLALAASAPAQQSGDQQAQNPPAPSAASAQPAPAPQTTSVAEAARKLREQKKTEGKPAKVFDNDNLPPQNGVSVVGDTGAAAPADNTNAAAAQAAGGTTATTAATTATAGSEDEKTWRDRFAKARAKLQRDQADLAVLQRELGKLDVQYYSDPVKGMQQSISRADVNDKRAKIDQRTKDVAADQTAISDLEDQLRRAGGDVGWSR
jgi:hypothetical protein